MTAVYMPWFILYYSDSLRFAFGPLINEELSQFMVEWNSHRIRLSIMAEVPVGVPEILYRFPEINGKSLQFIHPIK